MIDEHKEELASLYALGLLSGEELAAFQKELDRDSELRTFTESLQNAAAHLALTAPSAKPSEVLRARIFASIEKTPTTVPAKMPAKPFAVIWAGWAVAAGFAVAASYFGALWINTRSQLSAQNEKAELASLELQSLQQNVEANRILTDRQIADLRRASSLDQLKIAKLASLTGNSPEAVAIAVWNPLKQEGVLSVQDLPAISDEQSYQLWVVDAHHKDPVSGGVFTVDAQGKARVDFHPTEEAAAATHFAISRERKGGVPVRQGPIVALGAL